MCYGLLVDEQESMINCYLDSGVKCVCVVMDEEDGALKNKKHYCYATEPMIRL